MFWIGLAVGIPVGFVAGMIFRAFFIRMPTPYRNGGLNNPFR